MQRCKKMDHNDGREWEVEVWNPIEHPAGGNAVVNAQSVSRFYEHKSRSLITVPFLGKLKGDKLENVEHHDRIYPIEFGQPQGEFKVTLLSCVDLVYCDEADKTKPYSEWRGKLVATRRPIPYGSSPTSPWATTPS